jgi:hypothetical protein
MSQRLGAAAQTSINKTFKALRPLRKVTCKARSQSYKNRFQTSTCRFVFVLNKFHSHFFLRLYVPRVIVAKVSPLSLEAASEVLLKLRNPVHSYVEITISKQESSVSTAQVICNGYIRR